MIRIERILCPIDFSEHSRRALDYAVVVAGWYDATITVMHAHASPVPLLPMDPVAAPQPAYIPSGLNEGEREAVSSAIDAFVARDRAAGRRIESLVDEAVNVPAAIVSRAEALAANLVVMGTHGRTGFNRLVLGSVAEKVLRTAPCPVLCVPPHAPATAALAASGFTGVVCPTDFSAPSARTLRYAASIAQRARAPLTVVHVVDTGTDAADVLVPEGDAYRTARIEQARSAMASALAPEIRQASEVTEIVALGKPYREILRVADERRAGLIVMGVHGRGALDRMFFGSTTQHVVRQAKCPVLTVRDEEK